MNSRLAPQFRQTPMLLGPAAASSSQWCVQFRRVEARLAVDRRGRCRGRHPRRKHIGALAATLARRMHSDGALGQTEVIFWVAVCLGREGNVMQPEELSWNAATATSLARGSRVFRTDGPQSATQAVRTSNTSI